MVEIADAGAHGYQAPFAPKGEDWRLFSAELK
jgi:hypothetical protein